MKLKDAIKIVEQETGLTVFKVFDCGNKWILDFLEFHNEYNENDNEVDEITRFLNSKTGSANAIAYKNINKIKYCSTAECINLINNGVEIKF